MALFASEKGFLPVNEIYGIIEHEFPYYKTAPDGWKNSIRHNLSLNAAFLKVNQYENWRGKKGFFWEINPDKKTLLEAEVEKFLRREGKTMLFKCSSKSSASFSSVLQAMVPPQPLQPPPVAQVSHQPPSPQPTASFDTHHTPSWCLGIAAPSTNPQQVAKDLFGLDLHHPTGLQMGNTVENVCPLYTEALPLHKFFGGTLVAGTTPGPMLSLTPPSLYNCGLTPERQSTPYVLPPSVSPLQYFMYPGPATITPPMFVQRVMQDPVSLEGMSSLKGDDVIDEYSFKPEDPLHTVRHSVNECTLKRFQPTQSSNLVAKDHELTPTSTHTDCTLSEIHDVLFKTTQCQENEDNDWQCVLSPLIDVVGLSDTEKVQLENNVGMIELTGAHDVSIPVSDDCHTGNQEQNFLFPKPATAESYLSSQATVEHTHKAENSISMCHTLLQMKTLSQSVTMNSGNKSNALFDVLGKVNIAAVGNHDQDAATTDLHTDSAFLATVH